MKLKNKTTQPMSSYQTFLKDCDCEGSGLLFKDNIACCRWCRKPYGKGGQINYEDEHFNQPKEDKPERDWEILEFESSLGHICRLRPNGRYSYDNQGDGIWAVNIMMNDLTNKIHSVKRRV